MPKLGFTTITINEMIYDRFHNVYMQNKDDLMIRGITSFPQYITNLLNEKIKQSSIPMRFTLVNIEEMHSEEHHHSILIRDRWHDEFVEIQLIKNSHWCTKCNKEYCIHVGFILSLHQVYPLMSEENK